MNTGIYEIVNTANGKRYVGSAVNIRKRWNGHRLLLRCGRHHAGPLQNSWTKYGESVFEFRKLLICSKANLILYEQAAMDALNPEFNILRVAGSCLGVKRGPETGAKISAANTGRKHSAEARANMAASRIGHKVSTETRAKLSVAHMGNKYSLGKQLGHKYNLGRKHTAETKAKWSALHIGMKHGAEARAKMSASHKGVPLTAEHRANIGKAHIGKTRSLEARRKMSEWQRRFDKTKAHEIRAVVSDGISQRKAARLFACSKTLIADVVNCRNGYRDELYS